MKEKREEWGGKRRSREKRGEVGRRKEWNEMDREEQRSKRKVEGK
jgi:hypothetical protein